MMQIRQKIGLFGFGPVGQGTYKILSEDFLLPVEIAKICVKNQGKARPLDKEYFTFAKNDILCDEQIGLIVEAISDAEEAFSIVKEALEAGKHVVSANKKMISEHLDELLSIQERSGSILRYEAAVGGAIPIIRTLDAYFGHEPVKELRGVLNGSTNYILSQMQQGLPYQEALQQAQDKGFAEADPLLDVSGQDARNKLVIAALHAFGEVLKPAEVRTTGIDAMAAVTAEQAKKEGKRIKLLALLKWNQGRLEASVQPELVGAEDPIYHVEGENNLLMLQGAYSGWQTLGGKGAGSLPTGTAVVADIRAVLEGKSYSYSKYKAKSLAPA